jgi:hypothetical protein
MSNVKIKAKITVPNRSVWVPPPLTAPEFPSARSFAYGSFPRLTPPTFLQPWSRTFGKMLRKALIRAGKTSHSARTLGEINPEKYQKIQKKLLTFVYIYVYTNK